MRMESALKYPVTKQLLLVVSWLCSNCVSVSVFSIGYRSRAGWGLLTGLQSQTGGWRGHFPTCGSSPPWHWCGSSHRCQLQCSTVPRQRPPPVAWLDSQQVRRPVNNWINTGQAKIVTSRICEPSETLRETYSVVFIFFTGKSKAVFWERSSSMSNKTCNDSCWHLILIIKGC